NGGPEWVSIGGAMKNVTDEDGNHNVANIQPAVVIPIAELSVSEPVEGYVDERIGAGGIPKGNVYQAYYKLWKNAVREPGVPDPNPNFDTPRVAAVNQFGELEFKQVRDRNSPSSGAYPFEVPLDIDLELVRNGTTPNYRSLHLQRLANPLLPWNPLPMLPPDSKNPNGSPNPDYKPGLLVNPYLTVDSSSVDITAYNGADYHEGELQETDAKLQSTDDATKIPKRQTDWYKQKRFMPGNGTTLNGRSNSDFDGGAKPTIQFFHFKSLERGYHSKVAYTTIVTDEVTRAPRTLWEQEPANVKQPVPGQLTPGEHHDASTSYGGDLFAAVYDKLLRDQLNPTDAAKMLPPANTGSNGPIVDFVLESTLGFENRLGYGFKLATPDPAHPYKAVAGGEFWKTGDGVPTAAYGSPKVKVATAPSDTTANSTFPWLAWNDRPYVSAEEIMQVPAASSSQVLRSGYYSVINPVEPAPANTLPSTNPYANDGQDSFPVAGSNSTGTSQRYKASFPFGHLLDFFAVASQRIDPTTGTLLQPNQQPPGPNFNRILDYVQVPSRFVGTDELLSPDVFVNSSANPITSPDDPRFYLQPPFNKVSRARDPGRVNLNTILGRRIAPIGTNPPQIWSEVYDGIMHRVHDGDLRDASNNLLQFGHSGPAWLGVQLSRRGYMQLDAANNTVDQLDASFKPINPLSPPANLTPDSFAFGLNVNFPSFFSNPFRSADAGDLVPLTQMIQYGVDGSMLRVSPYVRGKPAKTPNASWGNKLSDARFAGFGPDRLSVRASNGGVPETDFTPTADGTPEHRDTLPLFSELRNDPSIDTTRNPYMMYQPMTRLGNLVSEHSGVFAVWVTVGYFEVEPAPDWNANTNNVQQRFGGSGAGTA
ncbi:MAG TPA: hypothetical protein VGM98_03935, partial [Schlesneria sp.]